MKSFIRREHLWDYGSAPMEVEQADTFLTYLILGVIVGGRLGYVLFYNFDYYLINPVDIIKVWDGGMAFHGGFLGVVFAVFFYCRHNGIRIWSGADLIALSTPPGLLFGRLANFINGELWGKPTDMPWGVIFPGDRAQDCGDVIGLCARHPSQLYEAALEGFFLLLVLMLIALFGALKKPGLVSGVFFFIYGVSRFVVEYFRVPDPQFFSPTNLNGYAYQFFDYGLTMGQVLSAPMILAGILLISRATLTTKL